MGERELIKPNRKFIEEIIKGGGESIKQCFQCSNCTVTCTISPDDRPFPRKEMIWAQWGLRDWLMKDPDIWLCHWCADCTANCPRGAKPGNVFAALRSYSIGYHTFPRLLGKALSSPKYLPALLTFTALLFLAFLWTFGDLHPPLEAGAEVWNFIPHQHAYVGMGCLIVLALVPMLIGVIRFWINITKFETSSSGNKEEEGKGFLPLPSLVSIWNFLKNFILAFITILQHSEFFRCERSKRGYLEHMLIFYGCILLLLAALTGGIWHLIVGITSPYTLFGPIKVPGNLGALLVFIGCVLVLYKRFSQKADVGSSYFDWFLILILFLTVCSGISLELVRIAGAAVATYTLYGIHIWLMFTLFLYGPFYKGAHIIYRPLAMTYARQIGRVRVEE